MEKSRQVVVFGSVESEFDKLFKRITKINEKVGPFFAAFCCGEFFNKGCESEWEKVKSKGCTIPLYIIGPNTNLPSNLYSAADSNGELAPNVYYLGKKGTLNTNGFKIAYLSAVDEDNTNDGESTHFTANDAAIVRTACMKNNELNTNIDILLTYEWPSDITKNETKDSIPKGKIPEGSQKISWLATHLKPHYIFSGKENIDYLKRPFRNISNNESGSNHNTTVFRSFTPFSGSKFMSAFDISLETKIDPNWPFQVGRSPFHENLMLLDTPPSMKQGEQKQTNQFFYSTNNSDSNNKKRKNDKFNDNKNNKKSTFDYNNCWFCLSSPKVERHLIISLEEETYITIAKGGLTENHFIISPINHISSSLDLCSTAKDEIKKWKKSLRSYYKTLQHHVIFYERNFKSFHSQIHAIAVPDSIIGIKPLFQEIAEEAGFEFIDVPEDITFDELLEKKKYQRNPESEAKEVYPNYFYCEITPPIRMFIIINSNKFPLEFGRRLLSHPSILNVPDRESWKECILSAEDETSLTHKFRQELKDYM